MVIPLFASLTADPDEPWPPVDTNGVDRDRGLPRMNKGEHALEVEFNFTCTNGALESRFGLGEGKKSFSAVWGT